MQSLDLMREPDHLTVITDDDAFFAPRTRSPGTFAARDVQITASLADDALQVELVAPRSGVKHLLLRWRLQVPPHVRILGDHWERGYGDLEWRGIVPERMLPWYFLIIDGEHAGGAGVKTGTASIAAWRVDQTGVSLWLDVRNGGAGVQLGQRKLLAAEIVSQDPVDDRSVFLVGQDLCRRMCQSPLMPDRPVYGGNNWYYAYGNSSHKQILADAQLVASVAPQSENRPFMVIDDGWQLLRRPDYIGGPWDQGNERFPDMPGLAAQIKELAVRPGIWYRPLWTKQNLPEHCFFPPDRLPGTGVPRTLDPSVPEVLESVAADVRRFVEWGYELIKHDFSTFDICGRWGFQMNTEITPDGWSFIDRTRTTAEIVLDLYRTIREAAGDSRNGGAMILGCNTIGHLAAGLVELQRTGDDTSGVEWERTRQRGVNTLAFRMIQQGTFFAADADCVGLTSKVPWELNRQWLDLVARSGTPLFVSAEPDAVGMDQTEALKLAFAAAAEVLPPGEPLDWLGTTSPRHWHLNGQIVEYDWIAGDGTPLRFS